MILKLPTKANRGGAVAKSLLTLRWNNNIVIKMEDHKKALDVTTKGWSKNAIEQLRQKLIDQGIKFKVEVKLKTGTTKWLYARDPDDVQPYCEQVGAKIIKIEDF